jgi:hypothetical protein
MGEGGFPTPQGMIRVRAERQADAASRATSARPTGVKIVRSKNLECGGKARSAATPLFVAKQIKPKKRCRTALATALQKQTAMNTSGWHHAPEHRLGSRGAFM